jgi:hypothetical protein
MPIDNNRLKLAAAAYIYIHMNYSTKRRRQAMVGNPLLLKAGTIQQ